MREARAKLSGQTRKMADTSVWLLRSHGNSTNYQDHAASGRKDRKACEKKKTYATVAWKRNTSQRMPFYVRWTYWTQTGWPYGW